MTPGSDRFAVVQLERAARDPVVLAKALAAARKTPFQDQMIAARSSWGIVAENLAEGEASALVQVLVASGVAAAARPASSLVELPAAEAATTLASIPNVRPILVAVAGITVVTTTTTTEKQGPTGAQKLANAALMLGTGLPIKIGGKARTVEKTREDQSLAFYADLFYKNPLRHVRIAAAKFDFSCLKERMLYQAQANLKLLMTDLVRAAPNAWQNHGTRVLLEGKPMTTMGYRSLADLEREARWLLTLQA
jgi:hypothetical protein